MRLKPEQLTAALSKALAPVYFISGDEPLQVGEMADAIRKAARNAGYNEREIISAETGFEWHQFAIAGDSFSLFADKKIIDLRLPSGTPGAEGAKALTTFCEQVTNDTLLLITAGKVEKAALKTRWFQALDKVGIIIQVWALEGQDLMHWLQRRMQQRGLQAHPEGIRLLASRIEGNLLAAAQEIEKLYVLYGAGNISTAQILDVVADSARYDVFKLTETVLSGRVDRILKVLSGIQAEGIPAPVVLWALTREARSLIRIKLALSLGQDNETVFRNNGVWDKRKQLVSGALHRLSDNELHNILVLSARADQQIKGQQGGDAWGTLLAICLRFTSAPVMENTT
jgi:DNA polymerase-3 subunit delta